MTTATIARPKADEHAEFYGKYVAQVPEGDLVAQLREQVMETATLLAGLSDERANYAYEPGKWTIKEVIGHMIDVERVMSFRALWLARNDKTELPGFDENQWVPDANFGSRTLDDLLEEYQVVRAATIHLAKHLDAEALARRGIVSGRNMSVRALFYIIAGHERHHAVLFRERYLTQ